MGKPRTRYFDEQVVYENQEEIIANANSVPMEEIKEDNNTDQVQSSSNQDHSFEMKRQRLLRKVDLVKQGWSGIGAVQDNTSNGEPKKVCAPLVDLDDSGPYEEIDDDDDYEEDHQIATRPPLGRLPSYISLSSTASDATMTTSHLIVENHVEEEEEEFEERLI